MRRLEVGNGQDSGPYPPFLPVDAPRVHFALLVVYSATIFLSAMLLFMVQPLVGKILLPYLGGTPAVWNTCLVFFQAMLLAAATYGEIVREESSAGGTSFA